MKYMHRLCSRGPLELLEVPGMKTSVPFAFVNFPFLGFNYAVKDSGHEREGKSVLLCPSLLLIRVSAWLLPDQGSMRREG